MTAETAWYDVCFSAYPIPGYGIKTLYFCLFTRLSYGLNVIIGRNQIYSRQVVSESTLWRSFLLLAELQFTPV